MSVLEHYYRHDADFKDQFEQLELEMEMCTSSLRQL